MDTPRSRACRPHRQRGMARRQPRYCVVTRQGAELRFDPAILYATTDDRIISGAGSMDETVAVTASDPVRACDDRRIFIVEEPLARFVKDTLIHRAKTPELPVHRSGRGPWAHDASARARTYPCGCGAFGFGRSGGPIEASKSAALLLRKDRRPRTAFHQSLLLYGRRRSSRSGLPNTLRDGKTSRRIPGEPSENR